MSVPVFRFAPSPNGLLHLGHAYSALLNAEWAARLGGRLLLRIEDIDPVRSRPDYAQAIAEDLAWLGLAWEEPVRRQSEHMPDYAAALERLKAMGLAYPCFCSRADVNRAAGHGVSGPGRDPDGAILYPGTCRNLLTDLVGRRIAAGDRPAWRLDMARALAVRDGLDLAWTACDPDGTARTVPARPERWGDPVVARRDVPTSYHLSVVLDDALQGVTHVVRGADLEAATDLHALLGTLLGVPAPCHHHHALIRDGTGRKLAKSRGSPSLRRLREAGETPASIRARLGFAA